MNRSAKGLLTVTTNCNGELKMIHQAFLPSKLPRYMVGEPRHHNNFIYIRVYTYIYIYIYIYILATYQNFITYPQLANIYENYYVTKCAFP